MRVPLVEDEPRAAEVLTKGLREHSFAVDISRNGRDALYQAAPTAGELHRPRHEPWSGAVTITEMMEISAAHR